MRLMEAYQITPEAPKPRGWRSRYLGQSKLTAERRPRQFLPLGNLISGPQDLGAHEFSHVLGKSMIDEKNKVVKGKSGDAIIYIYIGLMRLIATHSLIPAQPTGLPRLQCHVENSRVYHYSIRVIHHFGRL